MTLYRGENRFIAVYLHRWQKPRVWHDYIPFNWLETMVCFGFGTLHWERDIDHD